MCSVGCPIRQDIDDVVVATACGNGLEKGIVDRMAEFVVDVRGDKGELVVQVQGQFGFMFSTTFLFPRLFIQLCCYS